MDLERAADEWQAWVKRHGPAALLFARQIAPDFGAAEDAVQEGFVRFWRGRETARDRVAMLFACVRSATLDGRRSARRRKAREVRVAKQDLLVGEGAVEVRESVEHALKGLSEEQREVVVLKVWAGLTLEQVAAAVGVPMGTAASRYRLALEKMAGVLKAEVQDGG